MAILALGVDHAVDRTVAVTTILLELGVGDMPLDLLPVTAHRCQRSGCQQRLLVFLDPENHHQGYQG